MLDLHLLKKASVLSSSLQGPGHVDERVRKLIRNWPDTMGEVDFTIDASVKLSARVELCRHGCQALLKYNTHKSS